MKTKYKIIICSIIIVMCIIFIISNEVSFSISFKEIDCEQIIIDNPDSFVICDDFSKIYNDTTKLFLIILIFVSIIGVIGFSLFLLYELVYKYKKINKTTLE